MADGRIFETGPSLELLALYLKSICIYIYIYNKTGQKQVKIFETGRSLELLALYPKSIYIIKQVKNRATFFRLDGHWSCLLYILKVYIYNKTGQHF
jgi:hypothetical protein